MHRVVLALLLLSLSALAAGAQTQTVVTGTITDPNGVPYAGGTVDATLIPIGGAPTVNGQPIGGYQPPVSINSSGFFTMPLFCNTAGGGCSPIAPGGTQWQFHVTNPGAQPPAGFGTVNFFLTVTITGATQDLSAALSAVAPVLLRGGGNGGSGVLISGTAVLHTASIPINSCDLTSVAAAGVLTTSNLLADFNADPTSTTGYIPSNGGMLVIVRYPSNGFVNFKVCNNTLSPITPGAITLNWRVGAVSTIAVGQISLGTPAIGIATCATISPLAATGILSTDNIELDFNSDPTGTVGFQPSTTGMLTIVKWPSAGNLNVKLCNNTGASITVGAGLIMNARVVR